MKDAIHYKLYRMKLKAAMVSSRPLVRGIAGAASVGVGVVGFLVHYTFEWHGIDVNPPMLAGLGMMGVGSALLFDAYLSRREQRLRSKTLE